jgi:cellulose synthase (UDP-forming)
MSRSSLAEGAATGIPAEIPDEVAPERPLLSVQTRSGLWWESHPRTVRALAVTALATTSAYLAYRLAVSGRGANPLAFAALLVVEFYNTLSLAFLAFFGWSWAKSARPAPTPGLRVDVYVTTYDEPVKVVEATLAGCAALSYPHRTFLLDDGRRPEMAHLAATWGATWLTRPDNAHAKAGNINSALAQTDGELIFVLDADHVPLPDALDAVIGYFDDPDVALVQSPHDFYNQDSVQHYGTGRHEQSIFFHVVCPGKDRHNGVFWCGSATLVRKAALEQVGGVSTETIAEDFHTTVKMHRLGWKTRYHNEVLVQGLAPIDLDGYLLQRDRWARGNLAVFRLPESPLGRRCGLSFRQRASYFASLFAYGTGVARLMIIGLLSLTLFAGVLPARMSTASLVGLWLPASVLSMLATTALCRGWIRLSESSHYTLVTAEIFTRALRCAVLPSRTKFKVTPKDGADDGGWRSVFRLRVALVMSALLVAAVIWRIVGLAGVIPERHLPLWAVTFSLTLAGWELVRVVRMVGHVGRRRQRRVHVRFSTDTSAALTGVNGDRVWAHLVDVSLDGLGLVTDAPIEAGSEWKAQMVLPGLGEERLDVVVSARITSLWPASPGRHRVGAVITQLDDLSRRHLLHYCYVVHPWLRLRGEGRPDIYRPDEQADAA